MLVVKIDVWDYNPQCDSFIESVFLILKKIEIKMKFWRRHRATMDVFSMS